MTRQVGPPWRQVTWRTVPCRLGWLRWLAGWAGVAGWLAGLGWLAGWLGPGGAGRGWAEAGAGWPGLRGAGSGRAKLGGLGGRQTLRTQWFRAKPARLEAWVRGPGGRQTLRTQWFREQQARLEAPQEGKFALKTFVKRLSDVAKIGFEADFRSPETARCLQKCYF